MIDFSTILIKKEWVSFRQDTTPDLILTSQNFLAGDLSYYV